MHTARATAHPSTLYTSTAPGRAMCAPVTFTPTKTLSKMHDRTLRSGTARHVHNRTWAKPVALAALALCTGSTFAQVNQYSFTYNKMLQTSSILQADEDAAFQPITGGTVLADGGQAAVAAGTTFGVGYKEYETVSSFFGSTTRPKSFLGNASFVGNTPGNADGSQAEYQASGAPLLKTGPGYPIGFPFTYNGVVFDRVGISGQGWIGFGNSTNGATAVGVYTAGNTSTSYLPLSNTTLLPNDDRRNRVVATGVTGGSFNVGTNTMPIVYNGTYPGYPGAELRYETIGTAPNRVFVVQWRNYGFTINSIDQQLYRRMDFQVRLYETTNKVEVRFGKCWRSNTASAFQTGLGGKTNAAYQTFGFYDTPTNTWPGWPYAYTAQANHNGYPGSTDLGQRIPWTGVQGYAPYNNYGTGSAQDYYAAIFHELSPLQGSPYNVATQTISGTKANTPDMMSFNWTPPTCVVAVSGVTVSNAGLSTATLSWTSGTTVDYAVSAGNNPNTAPFNGTTAASSVNLTGLVGGTVYNTWVRTNCGGGQSSVWTPGPTFNTLPCPVPGSLGDGVMPITSVQIADINNASTNTTSTFENFTSVVGHVESPLSYPITVTGSNPYGSMFAIAYFDWNQDGIFEDAQQIGGEVTSDPAVFTGTINISAAALAGNARMRVVTSYYELPASACSGPTYGGQTEDYLLNVTPATCIPPAAASMAITNIGAHSANLAWGASTGGNIVGYAWEVRSSGTPGSAGAAASGTTAPGTTTASAIGLTANTTYTLYVRSDCGAVDGQSVWMSKAFTTELGCGSTWVSPGGAAALSDVQFTQTHTVCPDVATDKVSINFTTWNGLRWNAPNASRMYIYDGNSTAAPMVPGGNGPAYSGTEWTIPAGGWTSTNTANKPPMYTSTAANGCLTVQVYSAGVWTGGMGWSADLTCAPVPTCFAPTNRTVTGTTVHGASFSWNPGASPNVEYKVVAGGGMATDAAITSGTSATGSATTAAVLAANTPYTVYFRGNCGGGDLSTWSDPGVNFRTMVGCGGSYDMFYRPSGNVAPFDSVMTICPDSPGDVVTYTVGAPFSLGAVYQGTAFYVYNGPNTSAELFSSGAPGFTVGANTIPAGGYYGSTVPGPFTSSHASGCLTLRFRSVSIDTYYNKPVKGTVSCAAAPACTTPNNVSFSNIGGTSVTVSWGNTTQPCIIEYGPVGFTPGTGATAGTNGVVLNNQSSPATLSGLSTTTTYHVFVRQICSGPTYSANSFRTSFTTSMDCSTAQVLSCGQYVSDDGAPAEYTGGNPAYENGNYTNAASCLGGGAAANGPERLYRFTASQAGTYAILAGSSDLGTSAIGYVITPVANGCAASAFTCIGTVPANTGGTLSFNVPAAGDYYVMSDANYAVHKRPFTLACPGVPMCVSNPTNPANGGTMAVNTNNIAFSWPASFGATGYDIYWNGSASPLTTVPTNSITAPGYTTAAVKALVGLGNPVSWRAVPKNSYGTANCPTNWNFRVGGNGSTNAIPLTQNVPSPGTRRTANGYSNLFGSTVSYYNQYGNPTTGSFWGNDFWYTFTASNCATGVDLNLCSTGSLAGQGDNIAMILVRASDMTQVGVAEYADNLLAPACLQHKTYNPVTDDFDYSTPHYTVQPGETYYVIMDAYGSQNDFTLTYNEVVDPADSDGDGIPDCADSCPFTPGQEGDACTAAGYGAGQIINCECVGGNMAQVRITTDANPDQITWEVTDASGSTVLASGGPTALQANQTVSQNVFLPGDCYGFKLMDSFGDGLTGMGGWELRTTGGQLILRDDFANGSVSPANPAASPSYGTSHSFCLPLGPANIAATECGIFNNALGNKVYCNKVTGATQYQFEFSDPDAGFIRRIAVSTNYVIFSQMVSNPLTPGVKYFARVRSNVSGPVANAHWGSGCEMGLGVAQVVTCSQLIQSPAYGHSCNETRAFNPTANNSFIYATPVVGGTEYQFRIYNTSEGYDQTFTRNTYILQLKWNATVAPPLTNGSTYNVAINVKVNGVYTGFCPSSCTITIDNSGSATFASMEQAGFGEATLWPNPVRDGQVNLSIGDLKDAEQRITVDVEDIYGKQVFAQEFGNSGGRFNTILQLPGDIASGVYMVNITVNGERSVQRLSIVK